MVFADFTDVQDAYEGTLTAGDEAWVSARITWVETQLLAKVPLLAGDISPTTFDTAVQLVVQKVLPMVRNPQGLRSEAAGSFSAVYFENTGGAELFTADDLALFADLLPAKRSKLRMVGVGKPWWVP